MFPIFFAPPPLRPIIILGNFMVFLALRFPVEGTVYTPDTYPDSLKEYAACGLEKPGFACDPNGFLNAGADGTKGVIMLDRALQYIRSNTECICDRDKPYIAVTQNAPTPVDSPKSPVPNQQQKAPTAFDQGLWMEQCEKEPNRHGFTVSVVILGKMEVTDDQKRRYRNGAHLPAIFAAELKNRLKRGQCNDDALIVLAINDSAIRTSTGGVAATKLSPEFILNVSHIARFASIPFRWPILIVLILLILLIIGFAVFMARRWAKSRQTTEYTPGTLAGRTKA